MPPKLTAQERLKLIKRVVGGKEKVASVCRGAGISRVLFYRWLKHYHRFGSNGLFPNKKGQLQKTRKKTFETQKFSPQKRLEIIEQVKSGESVVKLCRDFGVSRTIFYRWLKRYEQAPEGQKLEALWDRKPQVSKYYQQTPEDVEGAVLSVVTHYPELSTHKIVEFLPRVGNKPILGNHGVQNVLRRHNLNTYEQRVVYSLAHRHAPKAIGQFIHAFQNLFSGLYLLSALRRQLVVRFATSFALGIFTFIVLLGARGYLSILASAPTQNKTGFLFATLALSMGMIFFLYSLKYYFILIIILGFSRHISGEGDDKELISSKPWWQKIFNFPVSLKLNINNGKGEGTDRDGSQIGYLGGLRSDLSQIVLQRKPFVSIHLALYNERRVVDRLLTACTSMEYENYEVVVVDDSTDETTEILKRWEGHPRVKVIHRESREGYKGGALKVALAKTNPKAEFILIFDADFLPYPDTITQFLKYFQATAGGLDFRKASSRQPLASRGEQLASNRQPLAISSSQLEASSLEASGSPIAAVQGYQWHVLNKSENWVTRGVRSEYAGSYVIERPGGEIMGALKQIAGSVYMIRRDVLEKYGWGTSITEDFELTLKLYRDGWKVVYTPYVQTPSECASTIKSLIRQRMRWAEGHSHNIRKMFGQLMWGRWEQSATSHQQLASSREPLAPSCSQLEASSLAASGSKTWVPSKLTWMEKLEFLYLSPYYLQAALFLIGTFSWLIAEAIFKVRLPFWTALWGWSLILTNLCALPLINTVGLFLEESEEKDYLGILSFIILSYMLAPFQGYASVKGFLESQEGPWFRTPKTGKITDIFTPGRFTRFISGIFGRPAVSPAVQSIAKLNPKPYVLNPYLSLSTANNRFENFFILRKRTKWIGRIFLVVLLIFSTLLLSLAPTAPYFIKPQETQAKGFGTIVGPQGNLTQTRKSIDGVYPDGSNLEELKPKEISPSTYAFKTVDDNVVEIGTEKHSPPQPYLKLNKWNNEVSLKVGIPFVTGEKPTVAGDKMTYSTVSNQKETGNRWWQKIIFKLFPLARASTKSQPKMDIEFYPRQPEEITEKDAQGNEHKFTINEQGGVEFDTILYEKPETNQIIFPIETQGLKFYYQPELTQQEKDEGAFRPENVVDSYAVYHESKSGDYTALGGKNYRAGKAFHIYRPKIKDASGKEIWGELKIDEQNNTLTITIDQNWLNNAVYPVTIDPNFGYETAGSNSDILAYIGYDFLNYIRGTQYSLSEAGDITSISAYVLDEAGGGGYVKYAIYTSGNSKLAETAAAAAPTSVDWLQIAITYSLSAGDYKLVAIGDPAPVMGPAVLIYYDSTGTGGYSGESSFTFPSTWSPTSEDRKYSIYATYTAKIDTSTSANATAYSFQRKTWYDGTRLWSAFYSGTEIEFWYSADWGSTWTQNTSATIAVSTNDFSIEGDSADLFIAYTDGYDIKANEDTGTYPATNFAWGASPTTVYDGSSSTDEFDYPAITRDSNSKVWITTTHLSGTDYLFKARQASSANDISAWQTASTLDTSTNSNKYGTIVPLSSGQMYAVWIDGTAIEGKKYGSNTLDKQTAASADDGVRTGTGSTFGIIDPNPAIGKPAFNAQHIFARWTGVTIAGTIDVSYIQLYENAGGVGSPLLKVYGVDEDNPAAPTTAAEFDADPLTTAAIDWDGVWTIDTWAQSPSLNTIFQELVDTYTISDEAVMVKVKDDGSSFSYNQARHWDYSGNVSGPKLHIEYTAWDVSATSIATGKSGLASNISMSSDTSDNLHLAYIDSGDDVYYKKYNGTSWDISATTIDSVGISTYTAVSVDTSNNDIYVLYLRSGTAYYNKYSGSWGGATDTNWTEGTSPAHLTSNYADSGLIFAEWTSGSGSPYTLDWDYIIIPEKIWLLLGLGLLMPWWLRKTRLRHRLPPSQKLRRTGRRAREE